MPRNLAIAAALLVYLIDFTAAGNTTCAGNMTQWYTDAVGETACDTYQRLRQICNPTYQVPNFRANTPGDQCDDQLQSCCCNSISWALSMLCMNCQWDLDGGSVAGIDAGVGAYTMYRSPSGPFCTPGTNQSLPTDIQSAVCNKDIKLANFLYDLFWNDGSWFYVYTMNTGVKDEAATNNNMYTHCNSTTSTTSTSSGSSTSGHSTSTGSAPSQTTTAASVGSAQSSKIPTIVGAVAGSVVALVVAVAVARFLRRKRQRRIASISLDIDSSYAPEGAVISPYTVPVTPDSTSGYRSSYRHSRKQGHQQMSSSLSPTSPSTTTLLTSSVSENSQGLSNILRNAGSSTSPLRHEDAGAVPTLARSASGRLPPAYDHDWEYPRDQPSLPTVDPDSEYPEEESPSHISDREPSVQRNKQ